MLPIGIYNDYVSRDYGILIFVIKTALKMQ